MAKIGPINLNLLLQAAPYAQRDLVEDKSMRVLRYAFLATAALSILPAAAVSAPKHAAKHDTDGLVVPMDEARLITFTQNVATLFVGNPTIADVTVIDSHHAYLLGKTFGSTNMIGLDANNHQVLNSQINVTNRVIGAVTLNRGADTYNYSCTRLHCETNPRPGDPTSYVSTTESAAQQHQDASMKAAVAANQ
jgi:hypothetical protein